MANGDLWMELFVKPDDAQYLMDNCKGLAFEAKYTTEPELALDDNFEFGLSQIIKLIIRQGASPNGLLRCGNHYHINLRFTPFGRTAWAEIFKRKDFKVFTLNVTLGEGKTETKPGHFQVILRDLIQQVINHFKGLKAERVH